MKSKNKVHLIVVLAIAIFISLTTLTACNGTGMGDIGDIINSAISSGSDTGTDSTFCALNYANGICTICGKEQPLQTEVWQSTLTLPNVPLTHIPISCSNPNNALYRRSTREIILSARLMI